MSISDNKSFYMKAGGGDGDTTHMRVLYYVYGDIGPRPIDLGLGRGRPQPQLRIES